MSNTLSNTFAPLNTILSWFKDGKQPTGTQFESTWKSFFHKAENIPVTQIYQLEEILNAKAEKEHLHLDLLKRDGSNLTENDINGLKEVLGIALVSQGILGNIETDITTEQAEQLPDAIYKPKTTGEFVAIGLIARDGYTTLFQKKEGLWSVFSEEKLPAYDDTNLVNRVDELEDALTTKLEITPSLTNGKYINNQGILTSTTGAISATEGFISLQGANRLEYYGLVGASSTRIALYKTAFQSLSEIVSVLPQDNTPIEYLNIEVPTEANYIRVTCFDSAIENFKIVLHLDKEFYKEILNDFTIYGVPAYDANNIITTANIIWNDGSKGVITYNTWNEQEFTYTGFVATSVERNIRVTQSPVTFDSNGKITNYPILTYTNL